MHRPEGHTAGQPPQTYIISLLHWLTNLYQECWNLQIEPRLTFNYTVMVLSLLVRKQGCYVVLKWNKKALPPVTHCALADFSNHTNHQTRKCWVSRLQQLQLFLHKTSVDVHSCLFRWSALVAPLHWNVKLSASSNAGFSASCSFLWREGGKVQHQNVQGTECIHLEMWLRNCSSW